MDRMLIGFPQNHSREFTHRVKSVSMAKFNEEEIAALQAGGNEVRLKAKTALIFCFSSIECDVYTILTESEGDLFQNLGSAAQQLS